MKCNFQGLNAITLFHGESAIKASKLVYSESAVLFSDVIRARLPVGPYKLLDLGSHKGGFLEDFSAELKDYTFESVAVDVNESDLKENPADIKINANLISIPLEDKSTDITISRYSIAWNNVDHQRQIIWEIDRLTKKLAIIQHQGSDPECPEKLKSAASELFGGRIKSLKRDEFNFSSADEMENWFNENGFMFERIQHRKVENISELYIEKYKLEEDDAKKVKNILADTDHLWQTTWVITFGGY